ncbi:GSCOCG00002029001-RA-CDS [Cotesia congregata]|nr:GSCOCG00002029001-RA-CDS [Cotesia congregata]
MKQLEIDTQKEKEKLNNSIMPEEEKSQKSDKNLIKPIIDKSCDDGRTNLEVDWDCSKGDYECNADVEIPPNHRPSTLYCDPSASVVQPKTHCMNETLEYSELIPVIGDYRPIAPQLGEYKFIPKQRWLNSLDNDAVVLLYHPCAERSAINKLRLLIMRYYERYIFTPYNLEETAPFAIVVKGCRLVMSRVVPNEVAHFLQDHGPQKVPLGEPNDKKTEIQFGTD